MTRITFAFLGLLSCVTGVKANFEPVAYNHPALTVDLGVGLWAWPLPMDWDNDGDFDLLVSCPDKPSSGIYYFENTGNDPKMPIFKAGVKVGKGQSNIQISQIQGEPRVLIPGKEFVNFRGREFSWTSPRKHPEITIGEGKVRAKQWRYLDYDGDGVADLSYGAGFWGDYGWDNAFDKDGKWLRGPLHGFVYIAKNVGSNENPAYETPFRVQAGGADVDVFGMPSPNFGDFDGDGDFDLLCGEFLDGFTYFQNIGSRTAPKYDEGRTLEARGDKLAMHVQMITPTAIDWDRDGDLDLIVGDEDGRVAFVEHTGYFDNHGTPVFEQPRYFQQVADTVKFGALVTPFSFDWDGDGDEDLICGNTSGNIGLIENLDGGNPARWAAPVLLEADGKVIHVQAGLNGSIQGPAEAKWGYTTLSIADWNNDELPDIITNDILGKIQWYQNVGSRESPVLAAAAPVKIDWPGKPPKPEWNWWDPAADELVTQWRTTPLAVDWNKDGLTDLVMLDHEGYLAFFKRQRTDNGLVLTPGQRIFEDENGKSLRLTEGLAGRSGRRKIALTDWDGDGDLDLLANSVNIEIFENLGNKDGKVRYSNRGSFSKEKLAGHTTSPTTVDWDRDGIPDLLAGAENGRLYLFKNPKSEKPKDQ